MGYVMGGWISGSVDQWISERCMYVTPIRLDLLLKTKGHIIRLLYLCPFHFFFTVLSLSDILYSCLLSGKIKKYKKKNTIKFPVVKAKGM